MTEMARIFKKKSCMPIRKYSLMLTNLDHIGANFGPCLKNVYIFNYSYINRIAKFCSMDTLELCGDLLQPGGQLETPGLVCLDIAPTQT